MSAPTTLEPVRSPATTPAPPPRASADRPDGRWWRASARFYTCVTLLAATAVGIQVAAVSLGQVLRKKPIPLKRPLAEADPRRLAPQYALHHEPPLPINHEVLETLGTDEYLSWKIVDTSRSKDDPTALARVFVTYYTGKPDMVPHVPDECYVAGGSVAAAAPRTVEIPVQGVGAPGDRVPTRLVTFRQRSSLRDIVDASQRDTLSVIYFFHTNGTYVTTRDGVRLAQANLFERYAYYAKVEVQFSSYDGSRPAGPDQTIAAIQPLLGKLLPALLDDHFPDWVAAKQGSAAAAASEP